MPTALRSCAWLKWSQALANMFASVQWTRFRHVPNSVVGVADTATVVSMGLCQRSDWSCDAALGIAADTAASTEANMAPDGAGDSAANNVANTAANTAPNKLADQCR